MQLIGTFALPVLTVAAFVRDEKKILLIEQDNQLKPMVQIYSSAGKQLGAFLVSSNFIFFFNSLQRKERECVCV